MLRLMKEQTWTLDPTEYNLSAFYVQRRHIANIIKSAKRNLYKDKIVEAGRDYKEIYSKVNSLLYCNDPLPLPPLRNATDLVDDFAQFYTKIENIMLKLTSSDDTPQKDKYIKNTFLTQMRLTSFSEIDTQTNIGIVRSSPTKSCELGPIPTTFVKQHITTLAPLLTQIVNTSISTATKNLKKHFSSHSLKYLT